MDADRFHVLINAHSGTASRLGQEKIEQMVKESNLGLESFHFLEPEDFGKKLHELLESPVPVFIGGGDGTIAKSVALHLEKKKPFGILPFGTMNLLAQDLRIPVDFAESLAAHKKTKIISIDVGMVNELPFLCCAAWGTMPEAARFREEHRSEPDLLVMPRLAAYIFRQFDRTQRRRITLTMDQRTFNLKTGMLIVSNNLYDPASETEPFKKQSLQDGIFGIYTVTPHNFLDKIRLMKHLKWGGWKKDPSIQTYQAREVSFQTRKSKELISVDGEPFELDGPYKFRILRKALRVIVPDTILNDKVTI